MARVHILPEELRSKLAKPMGKVFKGEDVTGQEFQRLAHGGSMVITVGDRVTDTLGTIGRTPDVQIVDGVERRKKRKLPEVPYARLIKVKNPAGSLTEGAMDGVRMAFAGEKPVRVEVEGEEDLMAMLAIAMAPVSAVIFYGQPGVGVVVVKANGDSKSRTKAILAEMGIRRLE